MSTTLTPRPTSRPAAPPPNRTSRRSFLTPRRRRTDVAGTVRVDQVITWLSVVNLVGVVGVMALLCMVSDEWWLSAALSFLPRAPWGIPALVLLIASAFRAPWMILTNAAALLVVAAPVMGFTTPAAAVPPARDSAITVVSSNIQFGSGQPLKLGMEFDRLHPQILMLQEAHAGTETFTKQLAGWSVVHVGEFLVASPHPVRLIDEFRFEPFDRRAAILCEVALPSGPVRVCDTHLNTPRHAFGELQWHSPLTGAGIEAVTELFALRKQEAAELKRFVEERSDGLPMLVGGDFNTPAFSSTLTTTWQGFTNTFEAAGFGYGYTSPCNTDSRWPHNTPWVRIDHIFAGPEWSVHEAGIGTTDGSDHRLIYTVVSPERI